MANPNSPFGMRPARSLVASANTQVNEYCHSASDSNALYIGDVVVTNHTSTSGNAPYPDGTPYATLISDNSGAGTTADMRGAVVGVRPTLTNLTLQYCPASTLLGLLVCDDPFQIFEVMTDGTATTGTIGATAKYINNVAGASTYTGLSGGELHQSTVGQSHYTLHVIRLAPIVNNLLGANSILEVKINNHELLDTSGDV